MSKIESPRRIQRVSETTYLSYQPFTYPTSTYTNPPRLTIRKIGPNIDVKTTLRLFFTDDIFLWQRGAAGEPVAPQGCPETPPADISSPRTSFGDPVQEEIAPLDWWPERHRLQRPLRRANTWNLLSSTGRSPPLVPWLYPSVRAFGGIALN